MWPFKLASTTWNKNINKKRFYQLCFVCCKTNITIVHLKFFVPAAVKCTIPIFTHMSVRSFRPNLVSFIHSFIHSFICLFVCSFIRSLIRSFFSSFVHLVISFTKQACRKDNYCHSVLSFFRSINHRLACTSFVKLKKLKTKIHISQHSFGTKS